MTANAAMFRKAIESCSESAGTVSLVFLHLSVHGNSSGVVLTSGEEMPWSEIKHLLLPMSKLLGCH
jgi:hypothetical protein